MPDGDKPEPRFGIEKIWEIVAPERLEVYDGPCAYTLVEMMEQGNFGHKAIEKRVYDAVKNGEMVRVNVWRPDKRKRQYLREAFVPRYIYDEHISQGKTGQNL